MTNEIEICARGGWRAVDWRELLRERELLFFLTRRELAVRYKQTVFGVAWAVLQPALGMVIFTVIFGRLAGLPSDGMPYGLFVLAGLVPWTFVSVSIVAASNSLVNQPALLTKVYLPRAFIPAAPVCAGLVDLGIGLVLLGPAMAWHGVVPSWALVLVPFVLLPAVATAVGLGMLFAALAVTYRDFRYVIPFVMQIWMYVSPVVFPASMVPGEYRWVLALNPLCGIINALRGLLGGPTCDWQEIVLAVIGSLIVLVVGALYFRRTERRFADIA